MKRILEDKSVKDLVEMEVEAYDEYERVGTISCMPLTVFAEVIRELTIREEGRI